MSLKLLELTYRDVEKLIKEGHNKLLIPVGTIEAHGPHLPLGTDALIPEIIADEIAKDLKALIAPTIYYGITSTLLRFSGTSTLTNETLKRLLMEIIDSYRNHGFKIFVILNGHGGNITPIREALNELWLKMRIKSIAVHWWVLAKEITINIFGEPGAHGGVDETAFILSRYPELVRHYDFEDEVYLKENGIDVWPSPGSIITYEKDKGLPRFDRDLANEYVKEVINFMRDKLKYFIELIED